MKKLITLSAIGATLFGATALFAQNATIITQDEAKAIALGEVAGVVQDIELETDDGVQLYDIEILAEDGSKHELDINAQSGEIIKKKRDKDDHNDDDDKDDDHKHK